MVWISSIPEYNMLITMLGCLCAVVQVATGAFAFHYKKKKFMLKSNDILFRSHRAFGGFATVFYFLGLYAGLSGFISGFFIGSPPFEPFDISYTFHTWPSFAIMGTIIAKTLLGYFKKQKMYKYGKWLGIATFVAWAWTWITSGFSYYLRTIPPNLQHPAPVLLLPFPLFWLQILMPFLIGFLISYILLKKANVIEVEKELKKQAKN